MALRDSFSWALAGNLAYALCQWGVLVLLARIGTAEMVGQFSLALSIAAPVFIFFQLNMRTFQATDARGEYLPGDYLRVRLALTALALGVVLITLSVAGYGAETARIVLGVALFKAFEAVSDIAYGLLQKHEQLSDVAVSTMLRGLALLAGVGLGIRLTGNLFHAVLYVAALWLALLVAFDLPRASALEGFPHSDSHRLLWRLVATCAPLGLVMMLVSLGSNIPQYVVERAAGTGQLGYFATVVYFMAAGRFVVEALAQALGPRLSRFHVTGDLPRYRRLLWRLAGLGAGLGVAGVAVAAVLGRPILELIYGPQYATHHALLVWVMVAAGVNHAASFLGLSLTVGRLVGEMVAIAVLVGASVLALSLWLVPAFGIQGAAWALLGGAIVNLAGHLVANQARIGLWPLG